MKDFVTLMKYREGEVNGEEKVKIEKLIKSDPEISEMIEFLDELDEAILEKHVDEFEDTVRILFSNYKKGIKQKAPLSYTRELKVKKLTVAATILIILVAGSIWILQKYSDNPNSLYSKYYTSYLADFITRSSDMEINTKLNEALTHYNNKEFPEAVSCFLKLQNDEEFSTISHFHLGMSYMEIGMYNKATLNLQKVINSDENVYTITAKWYLSLCYIKLGKNREAIELLKDLEQNDFYSKKASTILKSLPR